MENMFVCEQESCHVGPISKFTSYTRNLIPGRRISNVFVMLQVSQRA